MADEKKGAVDHEDLSEEASRVIATYKQLRQQIRDLSEKMGELQAEANEHALVIKTLSSADPERRCYRSIGGVLVEKTVKEVLPAVQKNLEGIEGLIKSLAEQVRAKEKEAEELRVKYNIRPAGAEETEESAERKASAPREGGGSVLA